MELHPMLDGEACPNPGLWYVLSTCGDAPSMRVGHTCTFVPGRGEAEAGKIYVIGGANPSETFCETHVLDLCTLQWDVLESPGLRARYEHAVFTPASQPHCIYVFGGADQAGNMNDVQMLDTLTNKWSTVTVSGTAPSPRTQHTTAGVGDQLLVYSGGLSNADPVGDRQVHSFDASSATWRILTIQGDSPKPRHGHVMVAVGNRVFLHGGMAGSHFYNDLHILDLDAMTWKSVKQKKVAPSARAAHSAVAHGTDVYVFGGMNREGALDDTFKLDTVSLSWTRVELGGPPPACRLDLGCCCLRGLRRCRELAVSPRDLAATRQTASHTLERELKPGSASSSRGSWQELAAADTTSGGETGSAGSDRGANSASSQSDRGKGDNCDEAEAEAAAPPPREMTSLDLFLVHGGMDTQGNIFDDCLVLVLPS